MPNIDIRTWIYWFNVYLCGGRNDSKGSL